MRRFSAHYIFTGTGTVLVKGIITLTDQGVVADIIDTHGDPEEKAGVEFYSGVITPGFVNSHCHLELSHLRAAFPEKTGLPVFLKNVALSRNLEQNNVIDEARRADTELWQNGIVAVGDVSNTNTTFQLKSKSKLTYHTFIETLGFLPNRAEKVFRLAEGYLEEAGDLKLSASIVPHSPYAVSQELFGKISALAERNHSILSMHSQESSDEDDLYLSGNGEIYRHLSENLNLDLSSFEPTGISALGSVIGMFPKDCNLLLVHNTRTGQKDLDLIKQTRQLDHTWFVICPDSNLFIEDRLPDIELFRKNKLQICLGTDGLSSNRKLSLLEEMKTVQTHFPGIPFGEMVTWATRNGAEALDINGWAGTIEIGKRPGINLITGMDLQQLRLQSHSKIKRLM